MQGGGAERLAPIAGSTIGFASLQHFFHAAIPAQWRACFVERQHNCTRGIQPHALSPRAGEAKRLPDLRKENPINPRPLLQPLRRLIP